MCLTTLSHGNITVMHWPLVVHCIINVCNPNETVLRQSYCIYMPQQKTNVLEWVFLCGTYIFKVALHKGQPNIMGRSTCVLGVDMFLIRSRQSLWCVTTTAVPQHWNTYTHTYTPFRNGNHMLISCHHIYDIPHLHTIMKYHVKVKNVTHITLPPNPTILNTQQKNK